MSRTRHARPSRNADVVFYVRVSRGLVRALKRQLAEERRRRSWGHTTMQDLLRRILEQGLARVQRDELLDVAPLMAPRDEEVVADVHEPESEREAPRRAVTVPRRPGQPRGVTDPRKLRRSA